MRSEAARWLEAHEETEDALRRFAAAGEVIELARVLSSEGPALLARGSVDAVLEAVALVPQPLRTPPIEQLAGVVERAVAGA